MTEIEKKALALVNASFREPYYRDWSQVPQGCLSDAIIRAIEQHEAFKREVSDAVEEWHDRWIGNGEPHSYFMSLFARFILPDPLVEALNEISGEENVDFYAHRIRKALAARGLEIRKIEQ